VYVAHKLCAALCHNEILKDVTDIEQVLREKKSFTLRGMLDGIKTLQGRVVTWNRFASSVSIT
jgi:hypothetical protein